jgi:hypothetical protein
LQAPDRIKKKNIQQPTPSANPNLKLFGSLIPDIEKLSFKRTRIFKFKVMGFLYDLLEDQESEDSAYVPTQYGYTTTPTPPQTFKTKIERDGYAGINTGNNSWNQLTGDYN